MIITTTPNIEGRRITAYHGVVSGEAILGANFFRDFFASIRDVVGGRAGSYEKVMRDARDTALDEMANEARRKGANCSRRRRSRLRRRRQGRGHDDGDGERHRRHGRVAPHFASGTAVTLAER
jgi:uncharacterized protein YbjQ (UPF0145 family)